MLPNFLLIGAAKAGTSSLHNYLSQHPEIFMSKYKEPGFFVFEETGGYFPNIQNERFVTNLSDYEALFDAGNAHSVVGESSTFYLDYASPRVIARMRELVPEARLLVVLRHPVDLAYSRYRMRVRDQRSVAADFRTQFMTDFERYRCMDHTFDAKPWVTASYFERLRLFMESWPAEQFKVMLYDDYRADLDRFVCEIFTYLGVDPTFKLGSTPWTNIGGIHRSRLAAVVFNRPNPVRWLARQVLPRETRIAVRTRLLPHLMKPAPKLDPALRKELTGLLEDEISNCERLTGLDLSAWRNSR